MEWGRPARMRVRRNTLLRLFQPGEGRIISRFSASSSAGPVQTSPRMGGSLTSPSTARALQTASVNPRSYRRRSPVVISPLSLEPCSAVVWRGWGRLASPRAVSPPRSWIEQPTASTGEQALPLETRPHGISPIDAPRCRVHVTELPRGVLVDGEEMGADAGYGVLCHLPQRMERTRHDKADRPVLSTRRSDRDPDGSPMGGLGG